MINMQFTLAKGVYAEVNITGTPNEGHIELLKQYLEVSKTALGIDAALSPAPSAPQGEQGAADSKVDRTVKDSLTVAEYRCTRCNGLAEWDASQSVWRHMSGDPLSDRLIEQSFCDKYGYPIDVRVAAAPAVEHPDTSRLIVIENLLNECVGHEITIARRRDGRIWITDGENTLSGSDLNAAIDEARNAGKESAE